MKSVLNGGGIGTSVLGVLGTRAESNFFPMGGFENRGAEGNDQLNGVQGI